MIVKLNESGRAILKNDFKNLYNDTGFTVCMQVLYEFLVSAEILTEVMYEKQKMDKP